MICQEQTCGFGKFCDEVKAAKNGDSRFQQRIINLSKKATEQLDLVLKNAESLQENLYQVSKEFTEKEIRTIRTGQQYSPEIAQKVMDLVRAVRNFWLEECRHPPSSCMML